METILIDFEEAPHELVEYKIGDEVKRENFLSFLILSFAVSRGNIEVQKIFYLWIEKISQSPVSEILNTFNDAGGFEALTRQEQIKFRQIFLGVRAHIEYFEGKPIEEKMRDEILAIVQRPANRQKVETAKAFFNVEHIQTLTEFNRLVSEYFPLHVPQK